MAQVKTGGKIIGIVVAVAVVSFLGWKYMPETIQSSTVKDTIIPANQVTDEVAKPSSSVPAKDVAQQSQPEQIDSGISKLLNAKKP